MQEATRLQRRATFCVIAIIYVALPNVYPRFLSPNEYSRLFVTRAILDRHSLEIGPYFRNASRGGISDVALFGGHLYSDKAIGMSLAAIPALAVLRLVAPNASVLTMLRAARLFAVTIPLLIALWIVLGRIRSSDGVLVVIGLCLGSVVFPQALSFTGHVPMMIAICTAAALLRSVDFSDAHAALAGLLAGAAILIDFTSAIAAVGLLVVVMKARSIRKIFLFGACCAAIASVQLVVNARCFNGPLDFAYHHEFNPVDQANRAGSLFGIGMPHLDAVWGLTFGTQGLFVHSPFLILVIPALWIARERRYDAIRIWAVAMCAAYFYVNSSLPDWEGGWSLGPRYLTLLYPLLAYLLVDWLETAAARRYVQALLVASVSWSVLLHLASMLTWSAPPHWKFLSFPDLELSAFLIFHGAFAPNLLVWSGLPKTFAIAFIVLLTLGAIVLNGRKQSLGYVLAAMLLFAIALSRATPSDGSFTAEAFKPLLTYMGQTPDH